MTGSIATVFQVLGANRTALRRARNLKAGARPRARRPSASLSRFSAVHWIGAAAVLAALGGALVIASHARMLAATVGGGDTASAAAQLAALQPVLAGATLHVPAGRGATLATAGAGSVLSLAGMRGETPLRVDLCSQLVDPKSQRLLPMQVGARFAGVVRAAEHKTAMRNVVLAASGSTMPQVSLFGMATPGFEQPLRLRLPGSGARWVGDAGLAARGEAAFRREGWLLWGADGALRFARRRSAACPQAGELLLQLYRPSSQAWEKAFVTAFPAAGAPVSAWLAPGIYQVPAAPAARLEDEALFEQLRARGLLRLGASGLVELAPPDLARFAAAPAAERIAGTAGWAGVVLDETARKLLDHLYHRADGDYVREQVRVFNSERRMLAWRTRAPAAWQASIGGAPAALTASTPPAAARLFAQLPQGWTPWTRVADWPQGGQAANAQLTLGLPRAASGGETLQLLLAGRVTGVSGARLLARQAACTGRACPAADAVQQVVLAPLPGARSVTLDVAPLDLAPFAGHGDTQYRQLRVAGGQLSWQPLAAGVPQAGAVAVAGSTVADRNGTVLFSAGVPSAAAKRAGLSTLLGVRAGQANGIAGMLARLPSPSGLHEARLTLDLGLQAASQAALDCIGMRRGRWDGRGCEGGAAPPGGRQAGIVVIDTETGDVLAAAGAGTAPVDAANWREVRDFDRADPASSPLRLPALQHDGGANRSPGSTFKVISALGLELAAQRDPQLDALLGGQPLAQINRLAQSRGFAFRTDAAAYPAQGALAHITNFRDQQLDRRARDGRLGLGEALTYSLNTWFAWTGELSDRSLFGRPDGGVPGVQALEPGAFDGVRPIAQMARRLGFERSLRLDGGLLPAGYPWTAWDALQTTPAHIDPIHTRHELRQMAIGLRMQATPLQMALAAGAVGQGRAIEPRLLLALDGKASRPAAGQALGVRLDRIRAGMKGVVDRGTAASAFRGPAFDRLRPGLYGKTGTAPTGTSDAAGRELATVWFTGWLEPGSLPGQAHRLALAAFVSHSEATGGEHAAPIAAAVLQAMSAGQEDAHGKQAPPARQ